MANHYTRQIPDLSERPGGPRHSSGAGQLRHAQDGDDSRLAGWPAALPPALHAHERIVDQPGRTVVRGDYRTAYPARTHRSTDELEEAIEEYLSAHNANPKPFIWTKSADQILESLKIYCERISETGH